MTRFDKGKTRAKQHLIAKHDIQFDTIFQCDQCSFKAITNGILNNHKREHDPNVKKRKNERRKIRVSKAQGNDSKKLFACDWDDCQYTCNERTYLTGHMNRHLNIKPYTCSWPSCEYAAFNASALRKHVQTVHEDYRPYACSWPGCEHRARSSVKLKNHIICHGTERPFKCTYPQCDKTLVLII